MTRLVFYDPPAGRNDYLTRMFFGPMQEWARHNAIHFNDCPDLDSAKNVNVAVLTDHLSEERIQRLKNNGCIISAFNVTDSSFFHNAIRYAPSIELIDRIFMLSGLPLINESTDFVVEPDFTIKQVPCPFLPQNEWEIYKRMLDAGKLLSLPYVPWNPLPDVTWVPFANRSQKVLIRGGGHSRRIILAMFLMLIDKLDCNSGMVLFPYFAENMNPAFRFCDPCRASFNTRYAPYAVDTTRPCNSPAYAGNGKWDLSNLGFWNNRCPNSFYWMADRFQERYGPINHKDIETLFNGKWMVDEEHQRLLARITFTSDLKWIHSIYTPQRYWQGALAGSVNLLPKRTNDQRLFPDLKDGDDYITFDETFDDLSAVLNISEEQYNHISANARRKYDQWIRPTQHDISTNLIRYIYDSMMASCTKP